MVIDQNEIDALKRQTGTTDATVASTQSTVNSSPQISAKPSDAASIARIRSLRVPLIAQLAARKLPLARIRRLSIGTILEFERSISDPLELLANNRPIGKGTAVKVGENFGLRIAEIRDTATRMRTLAAGPTPRS